MPAQSVQQARLMRLVRGVQTGDVPSSKVDKKVKKMAKDMSAADVKDFAETPDKGLPQRVKGESVKESSITMSETDVAFNDFLKRFKRDFPKIKLNNDAMEKIKKMFFSKKIKESAPEGWEKTVKGMKKHKDIDNPWALAHWMKGKGYNPKKEQVSPRSGQTDLENNPSLYINSPDKQVNEETAIYKDWDEFVNPHYINVHLKNGKKLKIEKSKIKGGSNAYHMILKAFNDNNYGITNKIVNAMVDKLGESSTTFKEQVTEAEDCGCGKTEQNIHTSNKLTLKTALNQLK
jgi:hypothetical protein